jgi:hypothetical protein
MVAEDFAGERTFLRPLSLLAQGGGLDVFEGTVHAARSATRSANQRSISSSIQAILALDTEIGFGNSPAATFLRKWSLE